MLLCTKLASERGEAEDTAGHEWEDGVRAVCDVVYAETLANNNVGRIPDEENHTRCIGCSKLGNKPSCRVQFYSVGIVHLTCGVIKLVSGQKISNKSLTKKAVPDRITGSFPMTTLSKVSIT